MSPGTASSTAIAVPDGTYTWVASGADAWQNGVATGGGSIVVDTVGVNVSTISPDGSTVGVFSPNGDAWGDTIATTVTVPEAGSIVTWVTNADNETVKSWAGTSVAGANTISWDGKSQNGAYAPDGDYTLHFTARDKAGTNGVGKTRDVRVIGLLGNVKTSLKAFYPQDADRLSPTTALSFGLARPATVTWTIRNSANAIVATRFADAALAAGTQTWTWDGRTTEGAMLPVGMYTSYVTATDGTFTISQSVKVEMNAFSIATSTSTLRRGSKVTVTVTAAESLSSGVLLYVSQPGVAMWHVTLTKIDSRTSRATITIKNAGSAGTTRFLVKGRDYDGRTQSTIRYLATS